MAKLLDGLDFYFGVEYAAFELYFLKAVSFDHLAYLCDELLGRESLAVFILAKIFTFAAAAAVFVKGISRERDGIAYSSANEITGGNIESFADEVEDGRLDGGVGSSIAVERVFPRDMVSLRAFHP